MPKTPHPVPRLWPGETFVCIASGPSLTGADVAAVRGRARVIVVNASYALAPWADVLYAADDRLYKWYWETGPKGYEDVRIRDFQGLKFACTKKSARWPGVKLVGQGSTDGLSTNPTKVARGGNSGYQAINMAVHLGAQRIVLLGYDMSVDSAGKQHWHADHPMRQRSSYVTFRQAFPTLLKPLAQLGIQIGNCSRETALTCFQRMSLEDMFPALPVEYVA